MDDQLKAKFNIKTDVLGPGEAHKREVRVLNRIIRWGPDGVEHEPDQRHAEQVVETMNMQKAKSVTTPGSRDDAAKAHKENESCDHTDSQQMVTSSVDCAGLETVTSSVNPVQSGSVIPLADEPRDESKDLRGEEATKYRAVSARLNYLCQDRLDIAYACKEASRTMSRPQEGDWNLLKRVSRYLKGVPRLCQLFEWQDMPSKVEAFVDSD